MDPKSIRTPAAGVRPSLKGDFAGPDGAGRPPKTLAGFAKAVVAPGAGRDDGEALGVVGILVVAVLVGVGLVISAFLILMVALGLTGVMWQNVTRRTREIGLRRALGARTTDVMRSVTRHTLMALLLGTLAGDDTILLILRDARQLQNVVKRLEERAGTLD